MGSMAAPVRYPPHLLEAFEELMPATPKNARSLFLGYWKGIEGSVDTGLIGLREAGYALAACIQVSAIRDDPALEEILGLGGELELPQRQTGHEPEALWAEIRRLVALVR